MARARTAGAARSVVPEAAGRSPWAAAVWTGLGTAVLCALAAIIIVAICWLPVSGTNGRTTSTIHAGLLTFLASVHGGVTVNGVSAVWLPLGMLLITAFTSWRAGAALGDVTETLEERDEVRLLLIGLVQAASFTIGCLIAVPFATLGTSRAPFLGVALASFVLFAVAGGSGFVRATGLRAWVAEQTPPWTGALLRCGAAAVAVYLAAGALLVAASLVLHHGTVELLAREVGGGWGGVPVLLLGLLAAPNAAIAGSSYLTGAGFALGSGTSVSPFHTTHGTVPAFPVLGAVPTGGATPVVWGFGALVAVLAGVTLARLALRANDWRARLGRLVGGACCAGLIMLVLGWQAGGAAGDNRLRAVGPSPWLFAAATAGTLLATGTVMAAILLGLRIVWGALRSSDDEDDDAVSFDDLLPRKRTPRLVVAAPAEDVTEPEDAAEGGELAG